MNPQFVFDFVLAFACLFTAIGIWRMPPGERPAHEVERGGHE